MRNGYSTRVRVGVIGVDAGLCWLGDPCYILHAENPPVDIGNSWGDFCDKLDAKNHHGRGYTQFNYDGPNGTAKNPGLGVLVSTGWGDGCYPVYATIDEDGRVASVTVDFTRSANSDDE